MHIQGPKGVLCTCMARTQFNIRPLLTEELTINFSKVLWQVGTEWNEVEKD
jgi:hypothetical protein